MYQDKIEAINEIDTIIMCQEVLAELVGAAPEGMVSTRKIAVLIGYLNDKQAELINRVLHS